ncbi:Iron-sulfur protein [Corynebacterium vitaeruminis DSM 20294]|uniref:Iron-sulfur protein n=2 Tax=Corynebacterium vitaeruminis TaxID=38305 RepID=W5Y408_9CORY|nr:Rieske (2Fe-2S) protein [Corynebacterium vitaeruminis]AHI23947.1 Iron-sulfur protein [Corynebacterium vitaeruminis DSM 20294]
MTQNTQPFQCSRRMFLVGTATTFAGALLAACGSAKEVNSVAVKDVPVGSAVIVGKYIVAQPTEGEYKAYSTTCPHAGAPITEVNGDIVRCTQHGSEFSIKDGSVVQGPARDPLKSATAKVDGDSVALS